MIERTPTLKIFIGLLVLPVLACARTEAVRTSASTLLIQASAAPACGSLGAMRVAQLQAAIETIKAGFDRYVIIGSEAQNNVIVSQGPGTYRSETNVVVGQNFGGYRASSTFTPGPTIISGTRDQSFMIKMFKDNEIGAEQAVSARDMLGANWKERVENPTFTCL